MFLCFREALKYLTCGYTGGAWTQTAPEVWINTIFSFVSSVFARQKGSGTMWTHFSSASLHTVLSHWTSLCLVLLRGPGSHNCDDERWEVSAEPAGADLTEVTAAHDSEHDQFSWGEHTLGGEIIARGTNRLMLSKGAFRQNQSNVAGLQIRLGCVTLCWHRTEGAFWCWQQLPSPMWLPEQLTCSSTGSEESYWVLWLLSGLYPRSATVTGVCFAGTFLSVGSAKQHEASWTGCLDSLCPSSPPHFPCIDEKSEHIHTHLNCTHGCKAVSAPIVFTSVPWQYVAMHSIVGICVGDFIRYAWNLLMYYQDWWYPWEFMREAADGACDLLNSFPGGTQLAHAECCHRARLGHCWAWPAPPLAAPPGQNPN